MATYIGIRILAAPFALANYAILGYVLGRGEAGLGLGLQVVLNGTNVALSILFGLEFGWQVAGVAWGTVCGEVVATLVGIAILYPRFRRNPRPSLKRIGAVDAILRMLALNRDIMIRSFALLAAFALFARQGAQFGTLTLAANAVLMNFFLVGGYFLDGFATAAEQLAGRAIGARDRAAFSRAVWLSTLLGLRPRRRHDAALPGLRRPFHRAHHDGGRRRTEAQAYLPWAAFTAISGVLAFAMDGVFIGATWSRDMRNMMLASFAIFWAALAILSAQFGNHGLWAALHVFLLVRGFSLLAIVPARTRSTFRLTG